MRSVLTQMECPTTPLVTGRFYYNTTGEENTAVGDLALTSNTTGNGNVAIGSQSLYWNTTGLNNTAIGVGALSANTTGDENTAIGDQALFSNVSGVGNTAIGPNALSANIGGGGNTAIGLNALSANIGGGGNMALGALALGANIYGTFNTAMGAIALSQNTSGSFNIALGESAGSHVTTADRVICIGAEIYGENVSDTCYIGNIFGKLSSGGTPVYVNSDGKLGTTTSSRRFKDDIKPMDKASEALLALKPVTFHYKKEIDPKGIPQFGLVAEEVEKVNPKLVVRDKDGKVNTVRYEAVNAMLLNEFLKEHRRVEAQQTKIKKQEATMTELKLTIAQQQKGMEVLTTQLKEQGAQIEKVSAQLQMRQPRMSVARINP